MGDPLAQRGVAPRERLADFSAMCKDRGSRKGQIEFSQSPDLKKLLFAERPATRSQVLS